MTEEKLRAEVTRLTVENEALKAARDGLYSEEEVRRACYNHCAGEVEEALAELRALRAPPEPESIHCPGTDTDCAWDCKSKDCDLMIEQEKARHGCG